MRPLLFVIFAASAALSAAPDKPVVGEVVSQDKSLGTLVLRPEKAADIELKTLPGDSQIDWKGRKVRLRIVEADGARRAEEILPADAEELRRVAEVTDSLHRETLDKGRLVTRMPSELVPSMALWDQDGRLVTKKDFLGHPFALNFIFTSCRNARMCPASTRSMKQLADELAKDKSLDGVRLLTITFDPETDTPGILRAYASGYEIDQSRHRFLTGDPVQIKDLMKHYGILTARDDGTIVHNAALILVSAEGRIVQRREGAVFDPADVAKAFVKITERPVK